MFYNVAPQKPTGILDFSFPMIWFSAGGLEREREREREIVIIVKATAWQ